MVSISEPFAQRMHEVHAEPGAAWLDHLPGIIAACEERWSVRVDEPFTLSNNYVARARLLAKD